MRDDDNRSGMSELLSTLGKVIAVILLLRWAALIVETYYSFLPADGIVPEIIRYIDLYAPMALMIVVGLEAVWDKSDLLKLVFLVICAAIVIFSFFPDVRQTIVDYIGVSAK